MSSPKDFLARCRCWRIWKKKKGHSFTLSFFSSCCSLDITYFIAWHKKKKNYSVMAVFFPPLWLEAHVEWAWCEGILCFVLFKVGKKKSCQKKKRPPKRTRAIKYAIKFRDLRGMEKGKKKKMWDTDKCRWTLRSTQQKYQSKLLTSPIFSSLKCFVLFALLVGKQS